MKLNENISNNFQTLKSISLLYITANHFLQGLPWQFIAVAMISFGYTSAFFTSNKYKNNYDIKMYFKQKFNRLFFNLLFINLFLLGLIILKGEIGLLTFDSLISFFCFDGLKIWFGFERFGLFQNERWFLTLLILFYFFYPLIEIMTRGEKRLLIFSSVAFGFLIYLELFHPIKEHVLWLTAMGFFAGILLEKTEAKLSTTTTMLILILICSLLSKFYFNTKYFTPVMILSFSILLFNMLAVVQLPKRLNIIINTLIGSCLLEIYLIHRPLFFNPTRNLVINYLISIIIIIITIANILRMSRINLIKSIKGRIVR